MSIENSLDSNQVFREVTLRMCGTLDIGEAMENTFHYLETIFPLFHCSLNMIDEAEAGIKIIASYNKETGIQVAKYGEEELVPFPKFISNEDANYWEFGSNVHLINDPKNDFIAKEFLKHYEVDYETCQMVLNLALKMDSLGTFVMVAKGRNRFAEEHAKLLDLLTEPIAIAMSNFQKHRELEHLRDLLTEDNWSMRRELEKLVGDNVVGADFGLKGVMDMVRKVAPLTSPVMLLGETGVGKDVIANAIHMFSPRRNKPFLRVNCGAIPHALLESELFGHEKGAFTGAISAKRGRFEQAEGGTIFLDEIGEMPLDAQVKILRVLQDMEFERVGGTKTISANVRIIAATNRDLEAMVIERKFRQDLWFRLNVFPVRVPPLRERREDIPSLTTYFIEKKCREMNIPKRPRLAPGAMEALLTYEWPGNVRELQNVIERSLIISQGQPLTFQELGNRISAPIQFSAATKDQNGLAMPISLDEAMSEHIRKALALSYGRIEGAGGAAQILGIHPSTLRHKMRKLQIPFGRRAT